MGKFWSLLFLLVPVLGVAVFWWAAAGNMWLPRDVSTHGHQIDDLFRFILYLTGAVFVATEVVLFWFLWRYDAKTNTDPVKYTHGSHNLEIVWTILPAATLLFIAIVQMKAWSDVKLKKPAEAAAAEAVAWGEVRLTSKEPPGTPAFEAAALQQVPGLGQAVVVEVVGRQFEWRLRYPGPDFRFDTPDDLYTVNDLHVPVNTTILVELKTQDVLHDFFLPNLRVKQDAVPGMRIPVWFVATETGAFDLVCAELCGWGHYKMKGRLTVESESAYKAWLARLQADQSTTAK